LFPCSSRASRPAPTRSVTAKFQHTRGTGIGPAAAFLYSVPAINVLTISLTANMDLLTELKKEEEIGD
jgi:hypothetical protein